MRNDRRTKYRNVNQCKPRLIVDVKFLECKSVWMPNQNPGNQVEYDAYAHPDSSGHQCFRQIGFNDVPQVKPPEQRKNDYAAKRMPWLCFFISLNPSMSVFHCTHVQYRYVEYRMNKSQGRDRYVTHPETDHRHSKIPHHNLHIFSSVKLNLTQSFFFHAASFFRSEISAVKIKKIKQPFN